ncbi:hypothetical protein D6C98_10175 [Aureobasidium pullulans]|nr:hypothetical protein D6C98_10175 [Aureobasidium pullulans]
MAHLPNEIWFQVVGYINSPNTTSECDDPEVCCDDNDCSNTAQQDLINLCLVPEQIRAIAQPLLYSGFVKPKTVSAQFQLLKPDSEWLHKYYQRDQRSFRAARKETRLERFLRTLISRPDLAVEVKDLRLNKIYEASLLPSCLRQLYQKLPLPSTTSSMFVDALKRYRGFDRLDISFRRSWEKSLQDGEEGAEIALLLTLVPTVLEVHLEPDQPSLGYFVQTLCNTILDPIPQPYVLKTACGMLSKEPAESHSLIRQPTPILSFLTTLTVKSPAMFPVDLRSCVSLLSLPTLTAFTGEFLVGNLFHNEPTQFSKIPSNNLRHLQLEHCKIGWRGLEAFLGTFKALQTLEIDTSFAFNPEHEIPIVRAGFLNALQGMSGTLARLVLMMPEYANEVFLDLRTFAKLRYLEIDLDLLTHDGDPPYLHELLPPGIQSLIIRRIVFHILPHLNTLLSTFKDVPEFCDLSVVKVYTMEEEDSCELQEELFLISERAGLYHLDFNVEEEPGENSWWWWWGSPPGSDVGSEVVSNGAVSDDDQDSDDDDE